MTANPAVILNRDAGLLCKKIPLPSVILCEPAPVLTSSQSIVGPPLVQLPRSRRPAITGPRRSNSDTIHRHPSDGHHRKRPPCWRAGLGNERHPTLTKWPEGEDAATKYWLSTLPATTPIDTLVDTAKLCWRIERDFQDLKQGIGLDRYEGRGWRGFHHHAVLSIAAYRFLVSERSPKSGACSSPPSSHRPKLSGAIRRLSPAPPVYAALGRLRVFSLWVLKVY